MPTGRSTSTATSPATREAFTTMAAAIEKKEVERLRGRTGRTRGVLSAVLTRPCTRVIEPLGHSADVRPPGDNSSRRPPTKSPRRGGPGRGRVESGRQGAAAQASASAAASGSSGVSRCWACASTRPLLLSTAWRISSARSLLSKRNCLGVLAALAEARGLVVVPGAASSPRRWPARRGRSGRPRS